MKIAIVEDKQQWSAQIKKRILEWRYEGIYIEEYKNGEDFLKEKQGFDIVFMDVDLSGNKNFSILEKYRKQYPEYILIVLTSHVELDKKGYCANVFRYIDKGCLKGIEEALLNAEKKILGEGKICAHICKGEASQIPCTKICYMESCGHHTELHMLNAKVTVKEGISELEEEVSEYGFYRVHRGYLVNIDYVDEFNRMEIVLLNGERICLSRRRYKDFAREFWNWKLGRSNG